MSAETRQLSKPRRTLSSILLASISLAGLNGAANAAPVVEGLTILLPDDGWYQVQSADYREVCGGVRSCEVQAGTYIVINHTTGERFEQVRVGLGPEDETQIVIDNNRISWPDDGWYQVQRAGTYESVCQGERSCAVAAGKYIVINHTTGRRWENVDVPGNDSSQLQAIDLRYQRYSSSAIELFWARQSGAPLPIEYTVFQDSVAIGSTEGTSFFIEGLADNQQQEFQVKPFDQPEGVSIIVPASNDTHGPDGETTLSLANAREVLAGVVEVINEQAIEAIYESAAEDLNFRGKTFFISNTIDDIILVDGGEQDPPYPVENVYGEGLYYDATRYSTYSCAAGGGVTLYNAYEVNVSDAVFDHCVAGSNTYSGTTGIRNIQRGVINRYPVYDFSVTDSSGNTRSLSGGYESGNLSFVAINAESGWDSAYYRGAVEGGELRIDDYSIVRTQFDNNSGTGSSTRPGDDGELIRIMEYQVRSTVGGQFAVRAPWSADQPLQISVQLSFNDNAVIASDPETGEPVAYSGSDPEESFYWQNGSIEVIAEDGSLLLITPMEGEGERDTFLITAGDGETLGPLLWDDGYAVQP